MFGSHYRKQSHILTDRVKLAIKVIKIQWNIYGATCYVMYLSLCKSYLMYLVEHSNGKLSSVIINSKHATSSHLIRGYSFPDPIFIYIVSFVLEILKGCPEPYKWQRKFPDNSKSVRSQR